MNLYLVVKAGVFCNLVEAFDAPGFGVGGPVVEVLDACGDNGPSAHDTGFQGAIEVTVIQAPMSQLEGGVLEGKDFGVGNGVLFFLALVAAAPHDLVALGDDRPYRGIAVGLSDFGLIEREAHELVGGKVRAHGGRFFPDFFCDAVQGEWYQNTTLEALYHVLSISAIWIGWERKNLLSF